ncbi:coiled-coil-helix-coiled-coil-helix domain-containing protein 7 [Periplaneta americana]|uniref:coiled-coil-helix-coiled-coil-helix domain-containing protein 7 n=1 Tax=Periplaneta americana TaxID=6978 RepID=UPI0037E7DDEB
MFNGAQGFEEPKNKQEREEFKMKLRQLKNEMNNPCIKENDMVFKCLDKNNYQHDKCAAYFENYKSCKNFWGKVRAERRAQGILPHLPPPEEREKIRAAHVTSKKAAATNS